MCCTFCVKVCLRTNIRLQNELERIRRQYSGAASEPAREVSAAPVAVSSGAGSPAADAAQDFRRELEELRAQIAQLRNDLGELADAFQRAEDDLRQLKADLGG